MQFAFRDSVSTEEFKGGLIEAVIGLTVIIPVLATLLMPRVGRIHWNYLFVAVAQCCLAVIYVTYKLVGYFRGKPLYISPDITFVLVVNLMLAITLIEIGAGGPKAVYSMVYCLTILFIGINGDRTMLFAGWFAGTGLFAWGTWASGIHGYSLLIQVIVNGSTYVCIEGMANHAVQDEAKIVLARKAIDSLSEAGSSCGSVREMLDACVPKIPEIFPTTRVVACLRPATASTFSPACSWPADETGDAGICDIPEFQQAMDSSRTVIGPSHCVIPIGHTGNGELTLVLERDTRKLQAGTYLNEMADALASSFLRTVSRVNYVSKLRAASHTDPLTGITNRRGLMEKLAETIEISRTSGEPFCLAILDLDHFKSYNDTFGHLAGDALLKSVVGRMQGRVRSQDLLARYGGEEFCILMHNTQLEGALKVVEHLKEAVHHVISGFSVTISAGVTAFEPDDDSVSLIDRADQALYYAKEHGRDRVIGSNALSA